MRVTLLDFSHLPFNFPRDSSSSNRKSKLLIPSNFSNQDILLDLIMTTSNTSQSLNDSNSVLSPSSLGCPDSPVHTTLSQPATSSSSATETSSVNPVTIPSVIPNKHSMTTRLKARIIKPIKKLYLAIQQTIETEPSCYSDAVKHPQWHKAMSEEYQAPQN